MGVNHQRVFTVIALQIHKKIIVTQYKVKAVNSRWSPIYCLLYIVYCKFFFFQHDTRLLKFRWSSDVGEWLMYPDGAQEH